MKDFSFLNYAGLIAICLFMAFVGLFLLGNFKTLFRKSIKNELIRQNIVAWLIVFSFIIATAPMNSYFFFTLRSEGFVHTLIAEMLVAAINVIFVFNTVRGLAGSKWFLRFSFIWQRIVLLLTLVTTTVLVNLPMNYVGSNYQQDQIKYSIIVSIYMAFVTGLVYILMTYLDAERNRQFQEKELELSKMNELKTKAELDALHAKVNPHFLYNALNSIADLSISDGKKARQMTTALADLFRYSINYSRTNYTTLQEELSMIELYLQIEKIRFEDMLTYSVSMEKESANYLIPRFILQPLVENAVKHGMKKMDKATEIFIEIKKSNDRLIINIADNGAPFEAALSPGYGVRSVYDKLDLLFPGDYEIYFTNLPRKQVSLMISKLLKNEPGV